MSDTEILNWIERHVLTISVTDHTEITWTKSGKEFRTTGENLRKAVLVAMGAVLLGGE